MQSYGEENVAAKTKDPINMKRPRFGIFSHLNPDLLEDTTKLYGFFPVVIESFILKNSVCTSKRTSHFTITNINWLTPFKEIIAV
jgi:hypothetical protein